MKSWNGKRYHSLDCYLKECFKEKIYKLSLDAGMTCPNRDGTLDARGCIFCSAGGSGDFAADKSLSITEQINEAKSRISSKVNCSKYIAYFQAYTNTYAPIEYLRKIFYEAINHPNIVCLSIATRPDCLGEDVLRLLVELNQQKPVWVELGLQTIHAHTADFIRRGYDLECFNQSIQDLNQSGIEIIVHIILGLPYLTKSNHLKTEDETKLMETIDFISRLPVQGVKLQLLHILSNTDLSLYIDRLNVLTLDDYVSLIVKCIERLPHHMVIHRVTGDGPKNLLLAPKWSTNKKLVLNQINHTFKMKDTWQGKYFVAIHPKDFIAANDVCSKLPK